MRPEAVSLRVAKCLTVPSKLKQIINKVTITNTIMNNLGVKKNLAQTIIDSIP